MKVNCYHGFFEIKEQNPGEVALFMQYYGLELVAVEDYFTFPELEFAPDYSIKGAPLLGNIATATFSGKPWQVMEANGFALDIVTGLVKPIDLIKNEIQISQSGFYFYAKGLINPGSFTPDGRKIKSYRATLSPSIWSYRYSEVTYF